jgi:hypothetical protein
MQSYEDAEGKSRTALNIVQREWISLDSYVVVLTTNMS